MVEFEDEEDRSGHRERGDHGTKSGRGITCGEEAEAGEKDEEPADDDDQQWCRDRRDGLRDQLSAGLPEIEGETGGLRFQRALRFVPRCETQQGDEKGVPGPDIGGQLWSGFVLWPNVGNRILNGLPEL